MSAGAAACGGGSDRIEGKIMTDYSGIEATREGIAYYLTENYHISYEGALSLVDSEAHKDTVEGAIRNGSYNYYPGDRIAEIAALAPRPLAVLRGDELTEFVAIVSGEDIDEIQLSVIDNGVRVRTNGETWSRTLGSGVWDQ